MRRIKQKIAFFVALMSLFYCISLMQSTYAKYLTTASASTDITIARWNILVNDQDVTEESDFSATISPTFLGTDYIREGVIAPTSTGYFDIIIDGSNTDVSFNYEISISSSDYSTVTDLVISSYQLNNVEYTYDGTSPLAEGFAYDDLNKIHTYRIFVEWNDDILTENMDNTADVLASSSGSAAFDINVNLIQVVS